MKRSIMKTDKYSRSVSLYCPTCGGTEFEQNEDDPSAPVTCVSCAREITRNDLVRENSENITAHVNEMGNEIVRDAADELHRSLKKAFRADSFIRIR